MEQGVHVMLFHCPGLKTDMQFLLFPEMLDVTGLLPFTPDGFLQLLIAQLPQGNLWFFETRVFYVVLAGLVLTMHKLASSSQQSFCLSCQVLALKASTAMPSPLGNFFLAVSK